LHEVEHPEVPGIAHAAPALLPGRPSAEPAIPPGRARSSPGAGPVRRGQPLTSPYERHRESEPPAAEGRLAARRAVPLALPADARARADRRIRRRGGAAPARLG